MTEPPDPGDLVGRVERDSSRSADRIDERRAAGGFAVALSGGGHRATLMTMGALLALVDRGLASKVMQISSVSGGSITNAFVAQRRAFDRLQPGDLDGDAEALCTAVVERGVVTGRVMALLIGGPLVAGVAVGVVVARALGAIIGGWGWLGPAAGAILGLLVAATLLLLAGLVVEWRLDRVYFRPAGDRPPAGNRATLCALHKGDTEHVLCTTDLVTGLPLYASGCRGTIYRRMTARIRPGTSAGQSTTVDFHTFSGGNRTVAELVRASAAFPGIPPRRFAYPDDERHPTVGMMPKIGFLADGGLWNNLATHVLREDGFMAAHGTWDGDRPRLHGPVNGIPMLVVNGSAPLAVTGPGPLGRPVVAQFKAIIRTLQILVYNTVMPRENAMRADYRRRTWKQSSLTDDPFDLLVDLAVVDDTADHYRFGAWAADAIPDGTIGLADLADWDRLHKSDRWRDVVAAEEAGAVSEWIDAEQLPSGRRAIPRDPDRSDPRVEAGATLGRLHPQLARRLVARGYLNTMLVSLFLAEPLTDGDLDRLGRLSDRLDRIVPGSRRFIPSPDA